ncbi:MAG: hypothetical protein K2X68_12610 [Novosphingobium sp.]|nr:hypothetical protein [Novosphingobium sp.]
MAAGILFMLTSGLCSLWAIAAFWTDVQKTPGLLLVPLLFGGMPFVGGIGMCIAGVNVIRKK